MKKRTVYLICALTGIADGICSDIILSRVPDLSDSTRTALFALSFVLLYVFYFAELALHELGHLFFGRITGWRFVSLRVSCLEWRHTPDGRIRCRMHMPPDTKGECLMSPPPWREDGYPSTLYLLGGILVNLLTAAVCGLMAWCVRSSYLAELIWMEAAFVGLMHAAIAGLPLPSLKGNDGGKIAGTPKDPDERYLQWSEQNIFAAQELGMRSKDMPGEWFSPAPSGALPTEIAVYAASRLMDALDLPAAEAAIRAALTREDMHPIHRALMTLDGACCELLAGRPADLTEAIGQPGIREILQKAQPSPTWLRTHYIAALLLDHDEAQAAQHLEAFDRMAAAYPYPQDLISDRALMALAQERMTTHDRSSGNQS